MTEKMTVAAKFDATVAILTGAEVEGFTVQDAIEFLVDRKEKATKKSSSKRKTDPAVIERRETVADFMESVKDELGAMTQKAIAEACGMTSPQAGGALRFLVKEGIVEVIASEKKSDPQMYVFA